MFLAYLIKFLVKNWWEALWTSSQSWASWQDARLEAFLHSEWWWHSTNPWISTPSSFITSWVFMWQMIAININMTFVTIMCQCSTQGFFFPFRVILQYKSLLHHWDQNNIHEVLKEGENLHLLHKFEQMVEKLMIQCNQSWAFYLHA